MPVRETKARRSSDDEDETPRRKRVIEDDDDDDEPVRRRKAPVEDDEDEDETPRSRGVKSTKVTGWDALKVKKRKMEKEKESRDNAIPDFFLTEDNDTANIQFLDTEPHVVAGHQIKDDNGRWSFQPCQLEVQRHCLMCSARLKLTDKYAFKILDFRGEYDKEKKKFKNNKQVEKLWYMGMKMAEQVKSFVDKKKRELDDVVIEVSRSGSGKATSYNYQLAFDDRQRVIKPVEWTSTLPKIEKICRPLTDDELEEKGFSNPNED